MEDFLRPGAVSSDSKLSISLSYDNSSDIMGDLIAQTMVKPNWWKSVTVYQVYPASFKDTTGNGVGDIPGIISELPYLHSLGIDTIWLSPMYKSPQKDMGYDISDYENVHEAYGTLEDMQNLIDGCHSRGIKIILDLVINHTSSEHAWFQESQRDRHNAKADWYIWRDPKYINGQRHPPNNWASVFGGSAWEYVTERDQYYLHIFVKEQPDLNWENDNTRKAIYDSAIRFWLKRGIDGFRIDTCNIYSKVPGLPDAPVTDPTSEYQNASPMIVDGPRAHEFLKEMRSVFDEFGDIMTVGELGLADSRETLLKYVDASRHELREVFDFQMTVLGRDPRGPAFAHDFQLSDIKKSWVRSQSLIDGTQAWTTTFAENHDSGRSISRFGTTNPAHHKAACKVLATMLCTMSGTLFIYQGQEIGMTNVPETWPASEYKDVEAQNYLAHIQKQYPNDEVMYRRALSGLQKLGRDNARTPMQWTSGPQSGFMPQGSTAQPWMRVNNNYTTINAAAQVDDGGSVWNYWKKCIEVRKKYADVFIFGKFELLDEKNEDTFCYFKMGRDGRRALVQLNFTDKEQDAFEPGEARAKLLGNFDIDARREGKLGPWEARVELID